MEISLKLIYLLTLWLDTHQTSSAILMWQSKKVDYVFGDLDSTFKVKSQVTEVECFAKNEIFLEQMDGNSSDLM